MGQLILTQLLRYDDFLSKFKIHQKQIFDKFKLFEDCLYVSWTSYQLHVDHHVQTVVLDLFYLLFKLITNKLSNLLVLKNCCFVSNLHIFEYFNAFIFPENLLYLVNSWFDFNTLISPLFFLFFHQLFSLPFLEICKEIPIFGIIGVFIKFIVILLANYYII